MSVTSARAIHDGIVDYFRDNQPPGSYLAANPPPYHESAVRHVIASGETLSEIALQYQRRLKRDRLQFKWVYQWNHYIRG